MNVCDCKNRFDCTLFAIVASVIIGIITAFLTITAVITVTPAFLWVLFGIAVGFLAVLLLAAPRIQRSDNDLCVCSAVPAFLAGILGTVLLSVVLLAITFAATSIIGAIITGLLLLFFSLTITSAACLVKCLLNCNK